MWRALFDSQQYCMNPYLDAYHAWNLEDIRNLKDILLLKLKIHQNINKSNKTRIIFFDLCKWFFYPILTEGFAIYFQHKCI